MWLVAALADSTDAAQPIITAVLLDGDPPPPGWGSLSWHCAPRATGRLLGKGSGRSLLPLPEAGPTQLLRSSDHSAYAWRLAGHLRAVVSAQGTTGT